MTVPSGAARGGAISRNLRPALSWLHTWLGLLPGWLLYFMFVTGTAGYLDTEIDRWMRPELPAAQYPLPALPPAAHALAYLELQAPNAQRWSVQLPVDRNEPYLRVAWLPAGGGPAGATWLDPHTGAPLSARDTAGGQWLYQMHWKLHYLPEGVAQWAVAIASMALLLALVTGVVVHRRLFADFFTFRPGKGPRSWLDVHNIAGVVSLPFQLMISYSGLVFLMFSFMPLIASAWYGPGPGAVRSLYADLFPPLAVAPAAGRPAPLALLAPVLRDAQARWGGAPVATLDVQHPGDAHARIQVVGSFAGGPVRTAGILVYDGASGALLAERPAWRGAPVASRDLLLGLHEGLFAPPVLRALYVLSGLLGCLMIATGLRLWTLRRSAGRGRGGSGVERANVAVLLGLPCAIAGYFWANRLLPVDLPQRAQWEMQALFVFWLALAVHAACTPPRRAWRLHAALAAAMFGALPLLNALTTARHLGRSLPAGDMVMAGFDLGMLALGAGFALLARACHRSSA